MLEKTFPILATLISALVASPVFAASPLPDEIHGPETAAEACSAVIDRLGKDEVWPKIEGRCIYCETDWQDDSEVRLTLRFNQTKCGGETRTRTSSIGSS